MSNSIIHFVKSELIGQKVTVNRITGTIIDETKFTFTLDTEDGEKKIIKKGNTFEFEKITITGDKLIGAPEERIKTKEK